MKTSIFLVSILSIFHVSCLKKSDLKVDVPEIKRYEIPIKIISGHRCDINGENENKEIFLKLVEDGEVTTITFYDFISASKVSRLTAKFEGFSLLTFTGPKTSDHPEIFISDESALFQSDTKSLSSEGTVILTKGRVTLDKAMSGKLEYRMLITGEDSSMTETEFTEFGRIENCEAFESLTY